MLPSHLSMITMTLIPAIIIKTMIEQGASPEEALAESRSISRDNARTPMQWNDSPNGGFSEHTPWLGVNPNYKLINAESQMNDDCSVFQILPESHRTA